MTFDEQITQAFDTLTGRLRGEIDREVERRAAALDLEVERRAAELSAAQEAARVKAEPPPPPPAAVVDPALSLAHLAHGFDAVDAARSLTAILDALLAFASDEAPQASVWLIRGGQPHRWRAEGSGHADGDSLPALDEGIPLAIAGQTVAVLLTNSELETSNGDRGTSNVALLARYAARSLEALTAFTAARALTQPRIADSGLRNADSDASGSEEETSARRYARLLVSEIKLYHERAMIEGRRDRDLATRLGGEIARARVMYEERVPAHVRERHDYFEEELVRTLANGDASLLELRT